MPRLLPLLLLAALLAAPRAALAEESSNVAGAVDAVLAGAEGEALAVLANAEDPDPWYVTLALLRRGESEAATRLAAAATAPATRGLPAAVASFRADEGASTRLAAVDRLEAELDRAASAARAAEDAEDATALAAAHARLRSLREDLERGAGEPVGLLRLERRALRARALDALRLPDSSAQRAGAFETAAQAAEALRWWVRASALTYEAGLALWGGRSREETLRMRSLFEKQLAIETMIGSAAGQGRALFRMATTQVQLGEHAQALTWLHRAIPLLESAGDDEYLGRALGQVADLLDLRGDVQAAFETSCRGTRLLEGEVGGDLPSRFRPKPGALFYNRVTSWIACASLATKAGRLDAARDYAAKAEGAVSEDAPAWLRDEVRALGQAFQGTLHLRAGRPLEALEAYTEAAELYAGLRLARAEARTRASMAQAAREAGDLGAARKHAERAVEVLTAEGTAREVASALSTLAAILMDAGALDEAAERLEEAGRQAVSPDADAELHVELLLRRARLWRLRGDLAQAIARVSEARAAARQSGRAALRGQVDHQSGLLAFYRGDVEEAATDLARAEEAFASVGADADLALVRMDLGALAMRLGRRAQARGALSEALLFFEEGGAAHRALLCYELLSRLEFGARRFDDAARHAGRARELAEAMGFEGQRILAEADLGRALYYAGRSEAAAPHLAAAEAAAEDHPDVEVRVVVAHHLADVRFQQGRDAEAMDWAGRALEDAQAYGLGLAEGEDASVRAGLLTDVYSLGVRASLAAGDLDALYTFLDKARASTLVAALGGASALANADVKPALRVAEREARRATAQARAQMRRARRLGLRDQRLEASAAMKAAQERLREAVAAIRREVRGQADLAFGAVLPLEKFQASLSAGDVALLYLREFTARSKEARFLVLRVDRSSLALHDLGPAVAIDALLARLYAGAESRVDPAVAAALRVRLFQGVPLRGVKRLLISPGEALAAVPFAMVQVRCFDVALMPSVTAMGMLRAGGGAVGSKVLALGDPDYSGSELMALPESGDEVRAITPRTDDVRLLGREASETNFYAAVAREPRWRAVHFACHGSVDLEHAARSKLHLAVNDTENDGDLETREVFDRTIPADLVVLSGCNTGRGQVIRGDGLSGLMRAFMQAGAPRVICSLWKVGDGPTAALMTRFYELWRPGGMSASHALRLAQQHVRRQPGWEHPDHWGAWVLWGLPD